MGYAAIFIQGLEDFRDGRAYVPTSIPPHFGAPETIQLIYPLCFNPTLGPAKWHSFQNHFFSTPLWGPGPGIGCVATLIQTLFGQQGSHSHFDPIHFGAGT